MRIFFSALFLLMTISFMLFSDSVSISVSKPANCVDIIMNSNIIMLDEVINMKLNWNRYEIDVLYHFSNIGKEQNILVGFPKMGYFTENKIFWYDDFHAFDGLRDLKVYVLTNNFDNSIGNIKYGNGIHYPYFYCSELNFREYECKTVRNTFTQIYGEMHENILLKRADYILNTGSYWKDNIRSIKVNIFMGDAVQDRYELTLTNDPFRGGARYSYKVFPTNYQVNSNKISMEFSNIKPDFDIQVILPRVLYQGITESSHKKDNTYNYSVTNLIDDASLFPWVPEDKITAGMFHNDGKNESVTLFIGYVFGFNDEPVIEKEGAVKAKIGSTWVDAVGIINGYAANKKLFYENNRVKKIRISYGSKLFREYPIDQISSGEKSEEFTIKDTMDIQYIKFKKPVMASYIKFTILDIYTGTKYIHDTCLSKIKIITTKNYAITN